jgi:hypothetical protein
MYGIKLGDGDYNVVGYCVNDGVDNCVNNGVNRVLMMVWMIALKIVLIWY